MCRAPHEMAARYAGRRLDILTANRYTKRDTAGLSHTHPTPRTPGPPAQTAALPLFPEKRPKPRHLRPDKQCRVNEL